MKKYCPLLFLLLCIPNINSSSKFPINELGSSVGSVIIFSGIIYLWSKQKIKQLELENAALKNKVEQLQEINREMQNIIYDMSDPIQAARPQPSAPPASAIQPENPIPVNPIYPEYPAPDFSKH
jgi:hypothetical protein